MEAPKKFYGQCGEDKYLYERFFKDDPIAPGSGVYFEAGALDGVKYSNTLFFEESLGWSGILVEPNPTQYAELLRTRGGNLKNLCLNCVISDSPTPVEFIYSDVHHAAVSAVGSTVPLSHHIDYYRKVKTNRVYLQPQTLDQVLQQANVPLIDLFVLDVEGHELNVLKSFSWDIPIRVMMIEKLDQTQAAKQREIRKLLKENGYIFDSEFKHNEIYIHRLFASNE